MKNLSEIVSLVSIGGKQFAMVPVAAMRVDRAYQRILKPYVRKMTATWDYQKCDVLIVSYRDGRFYIVDGQHRYEAAKAKGVEFLACQILEGMNQIQEASRFLSQNTLARTLTPYDTWNANLLVGDRIDRIIDRVCKEFDLQIMGVKGKKGPGIIGSLVEARTIVRKQGEEGLRWVLGVLDAAQWNQKSNGHNSIIMKALRTFYGAHKNEIFRYTDRAKALLFETTPSMFQAKAVSWFSECDTSFAVTKYLSYQLTGEPSPFEEAAAA
jgi:hypothetical protein